MVTPSDTYLSAKLDDHFDCALFRLAPKPKVFLQLKINPSFGYEFDEYRLAAVLFDGIKDVDFCQMKSMNTLIECIESEPSFVFNPIDMSGVVWHGQVNEGSGIIGKILNSKEVMFRIYLKGLSTHDVKMPDETFISWQDSIRTNILGLEVE